MEWGGWEWRVNGEQSETEPDMTERDGVKSGVAK